MKSKNFNIEEALQTISETFCRNGYEGTSFDILTKKTGVGKQSLYNAYGDKKELLYKSMQCAAMNSRPGQALKDSQISGRKRIESFFTLVLEEYSDPAHPGCLVTNLLLEKGASDIEIWKIASCQWNNTRASFQQVLEDGVTDLSIRQEVNPEVTSFILMNLLGGLRITMRATNDLEKLKKIVKINLEALL